MLAKRIDTNQFDTLSEGDVCMLAGTQSVFVAEQVDAELNKRLNEFDIDITAPMWGRGKLMTQGEVQKFELSVVEKKSNFTDGLERFGLKQERRRIRLMIQQPKLSMENDILTVSFCLPSGCYATTILRELIDYHDATPRNDHNHRETKSN